MKRGVAVSLLIFLILASCSKEKEGSTAACGAKPAALATAPTLPAGFPTPSEVTFTAIRTAGPSTIVDGFWDGDLGDAFDGYKTGFAASGYTVTHDEKEADDAEVNFSGGNSTGQVKLVTACEGRTSVEITVRPA